MRGGQAAVRRHEQDKTTTTFTTHFGSAAPPQATLDWIVYRRQHEAFGGGVLSGGLNVLLWLSYIVMLSLYASAFGSYFASLLPSTAPGWAAKLALSTAIVALTADVLRKNANEVMRAGLDGYLVKPLEEHKLRELISQLFEVAPQTAVVKSATPAAASSRNTGKSMSRLTVSFKAISMDKETSAAGPPLVPAGEAIDQMMRGLA